MPAYEVDLWGKIRRANEAARAQLLATQDAQRTVRQTLVAQVATAYLDLLALDYELEIARRTYEARTNSLVLTVAREEGGVAAMQDVAQAKILVYGAEASIVDIQRQREQQENALCILLGRNPGSIQRGPGFTDQQVRARSARRPALVAAGAPPGHPVRGATTGRRQCEHRPGQSGILSATHPHRSLWLPNRGAVRPVQRARADLAVRSGRDVCRCSPAAACAPT